MKRFLCVIGLAAAVMFLPACRTISSLSGSGAKALMIGVSPNYPPLMFMQNGGIAGAEVDLASELGKALNRPVRFLQVRWDDQIDTLLAGRIDIIMSGMTITAARKVRIAFSDPYLQLGIMPLVRTRDAAKYSSAEKIINGDARIGVERGSTADVFANRSCRSTSISYVQPIDAYFFLVNRRIDVFLHDGPGVIWLAAKHEADLQAIRLPLTRDDIAWGLRKDDTELLAAVNRALAAWKKDGTLQKILDKWLPTERN
ncbi:MAG: transporter substrate-binding domain-containing protein [Kiritimatiellae bacterium]|nr:transporter substrate-binding domain-containing protein [Kiritimatiellia bacterium]